MTTDPTSIPDGDESTAEIELAPVDALEAKRLLRLASQGETLSRDQRRVVLRFTRARDEALRAKHYATVPLRKWAAWAGRQARTIKDQAETYRLPALNGETINLEKLAREFHDFLSVNAAQLAGSRRDGAGGTLSAQVKSVDLEWKQLRNAEKRALLVRADAIGLAFSMAMKNIRRAGERIEANFGPGASAPLQEAAALAREEWLRQFPVDPSLLGPLPPAPSPASTPASPTTAPSVPTPPLPTAPSLPSASSTPAQGNTP